MKWKGKLLVAVILIEQIVNVIILNELRLVLDQRFCHFINRGIVQIAARDENIRDGNSKNRLLGLTV